MHDTLVSTADLHARLDDPDWPEWVAVDCRFDLGDPQAGRRRYLAGHVPGARYAHLDDDLSDRSGGGGGRHPLPAPDRLRALFGRLGVDARVQVVAYDDAGGAMAARLWWLLRYMGHDAAAVLDGGWPAWEAAGGAVTSGPEPAPPPRRFEGTPRREWVADAGAAARAPVLVDARDAARYRGETEPLDPVAGHIPGARNLFFGGNLDASGRFLPPGRLADRLATVLGDRPASDAVFYCGSGVTACHGLLAAARAGLPMPRLYAGSWSEWCADPARPVAVGAAP